MIFNYYGNLGALEDSTWLPTAAEINSATNELDLKIRSLDAEMFAAPSNLKTQWTLFLDEWNGWEDEWWFNSWQRRREVLNYRRRFNELHDTFKRLVGSSLVTPFTEEQTSEDPPGVFDRIDVYAKWALILGLVIGGGYALGKVTGVAKVIKG